MSTIIKFKTKYNLAIGWFVLGSIFLLAFILGKTVVSQLKEEGIGSIIIFSFLYSILVIYPYILAFFKTQKFEIDDSILKITYLFGILKEEIDLNNIVKIVAKEKPISYSKDLRLMMGINKIKDIQIQFRDNTSMKIDGNIIHDEDYLRFKQMILSFRKNN